MRIKYYLSFNDDDKESSGVLIKEVDGLFYEFRLSRSGLFDWCQMIYINEPKVEFNFSKFKKINEYEFPEYYTAVLQIMKDAFYEDVLT